MARLANTIEAILYLKARPLTLAQLAELAGCDRDAAEEGLIELMGDYAHRDSALEISETENGYCLQLKTPFKPLVEELIPLEIGLGALRTLAAIALSGTISQTELVELRGSGAYQHVPELIDQGLVRKRRQSDGRSFWLHVTEKFYQRFEIDKLPKITLPKKGRNAAKSDGDEADTEADVTEASEATPTDTPPAEADPSASEATAAPAEVTPAEVTPDDNIAKASNEDGNLASDDVSDVDDAIQVEADAAPAIGSSDTLSAAAEETPAENAPDVEAVDDTEAVGDGSVIATDDGPGVLPEPLPEGATSTADVAEGVDDFADAEPVANVSAPEVALKATSSP